MRVEPPIASPATLAEAFALLASGEVWRPIAGGTDLIVQMTGDLAPPPERVLDIWRIPELRGITVGDGALTMGALTTYTQIRYSDACREHLPALWEAAATIGAAQIQNRGTIGGNIANASPAGDTFPALAVYEATVRVVGPGGRRAVPMAE
ncbi:MAG TPA: FAD binding domain-containing protein, partial [Candidatus Limnocylindrales bacterium]